jgi:hypothetical protein
MRSITFTRRETLALAPADIAGQILDLAKWPEFAGYGPLPGIQSAEFEARTPEVVGTRIKVTNTDGSVHVEEIVEWQADTRPPSASACSTPEGVTDRFTTRPRPRLVLLVLNARRRH